MDWTKNEMLDLLRLNLDYEPLHFLVPAKIRLPNGQIVYGSKKETLHVPVGYLRGRDATRFQRSP